MKTVSKLIMIVVVMMTLSIVSSENMSSSQQRIVEGTLTPEFSNIDINGKSLIYTRSCRKALMLAFVSSKQKHSQKAVESILSSLSNIPASKLASLQVVFVMQEMDNLEFIESIQQEMPFTIQIYHDNQRILREKFGVKATPTLFISDAEGKVFFAKPGFSDDYGSEITSSLSQLHLQRRIDEGERTPEFSAVDTNSNSFVYRRANGKILFLVFLSSQQKNSQMLTEDVIRVLTDIPKDKLNSLQVAFIMENVNDAKFIALIQHEAPSVVQIIHDEQHMIWGKFGIIAMPTILISNAQGDVLCVKPGRSYDVAPVLKSQLYKALDIPCEIRQGDASTVRTVDNMTNAAKAKRHLHMAKVLIETGRVDSAYKEGQRALEIDPNSAEVAVELGEILCQAGRAQGIHKSSIKEVPNESHHQKARMKLALGWAYGEQGNLIEAERLLLEGIHEDPTCPRLLFELGRIYQRNNNSEGAMLAYYQALQLIYCEK